ncbi:hypothetical protein ABT127_25690 [Streptomyces sp. NPDC001904]|uniref:hypothetical protein n=1 Tax=Streptomyces sp. NPDC001904 TaxID=3154531 RepID=UPI003321FEB2
MRRLIGLWRRVATGVGLTLLLAAAVATVPTPAAAASAGTAPVTSFSYTSSPGDFIGQGRSGTFTAPQDGISALNPVEVDPGLIRVFVSDGDTDWMIEFAGAQGELLTPGVYRDAERAAFRTGRSPGLAVTGNGHGCNEVYGDFTVHQVAHDADGQVTLLDATFTQHCETADAPPLKGRVKYRAQPLSYGYTSDPGDHVGNGTTGSYTGATSTFGVRGTDRTIEYTASGKRATWSVRLEPPEGEKFVVGKVYRAERFRGQGIAALDVDGLKRGCNTLTGEFRLTRLVTDRATGEVTAFAATFVQHCEDAEPALRGTVHYFA